MMKKQNWWDQYPEVEPSPVPLPGPGGFDPYSPEDKAGADQFQGLTPDQAVPAGYGQPYPIDGRDGQALDRATAIRHAAAAIQRGADPNAVRARLIQMGHGDPEPSSPFSDLIPKSRPGTMGDSAPPPMQAQPAFGDQGGFAPRAVGASFALDPLGRLPQRLDPRLAPQKSDNLQKSSRQTGSAGVAGQTTLFTYGLPSFPGDDQSRRDNLPRDPVGENGRAIGDARTSNRGANPLGLNGFGYVPPPGDENLLARFLYSEFSSADNWRDMPAGAWTAINRIRPNGHWPPYRTDTLGTSLRDVLNKRGRDRTPQYSWVPAGGIDAPGGSARWQESAHPERLTGSARQAWLWASDTARRVLTGIDPDPTGGATYFHNRSMGVPPQTRGWFGRARTITLAPYRSPNDRNFFYRHLEDPVRPIP